MADEFIGTIESAVHEGQMAAGVLDAELASIQARHGAGKLTDDELRVYSDRAQTKYAERIADLQGKARAVVLDWAGGLDARRQAEQEVRVAEATSHLAKAGPGALQWLKAEVKRIGKAEAMRRYRDARGFERWGLEAILPDVLDAGELAGFHSMVVDRHRQDNPLIYELQHEIERAVALQDRIDHKAYLASLEARFRIK